MISCSTNPNCKMIDECDKKIDCTTYMELSEGKRTYICGRSSCKYSNQANNSSQYSKEAERLAENLQGNPFPAFDRIAKDIRERQDNAIAMEFTKCIGELLRKNGAVPKLTEYTRNFETDKTFETRYGVSIDELDFSEHDKVFEDKIAELENIINNKLGNWDKHGITYQEILDMKAENDLSKQRIAELESKETSELPFDPLECANYLINATYERETNGIERAFHNLPDKVNSDRYTVDDLEQIAEHLLVYCKHNKESEE